jgi:hypothetical protein
MGPGFISVLLGKGDGTFLPQTQYTTANGSDALIAADFNHDGKLDLAVADVSYFSPPSNMEILLGNGDGTFQSPVGYAVGISPVALVAGDVNGDGVPDLIVSNQAFGGSNTTLSVFLGNGDGTFQPQLVYATAYEPYGLVLADFNGDGRLDVGVASYNDGSLNDLVVYLQTTVTVAPATLTFATQVAGTASPLQYVTLTNLGMTSLSISKIGVTGTEAKEFFDQSMCGSTLRGGQGCKVGVGFKPRSRGVQIASLTITDSAPGSPQTVSLSGTGTLISLSPSSVDFGRQAVNTTSPPQSVTVTNVGKVALRLLLVSIPDAQFVQTNNCGNSLDGGASCTVSITFTPASKGPHHTVLRIHDNGGGSPQAIPLSGTGT